MGEFSFYSALGELRGTIGPQVVLLSSSYKIDVEAELAQILPVRDKD